jgi:hypothetical protein
MQLDGGCRSHRRDRTFNAVRDGAGLAGAPGKQYQMTCFQYGGDPLGNHVAGDGVNVSSEEAGIVASGPFSECLQPGP